MPSAVDFLPPNIRELVNLATSLSRYLGSGVIFRLGTSRRRGIARFFLLTQTIEIGVLGLSAASALRALHAVLAALAVAVRLVRAARSRGAGGVEGAAHDVVTHTRQILHTTSADEHHAVLLEVVSLTGDVADDFHAVGEADAAHLAEGRVRLLRRRRVDAHAHASLLGAGPQGRGVRRGPLRFTAVADQLLDSRHGFKLG